MLKLYETNMFLIILGVVEKSKDKTKHPKPSETKMLDHFFDNTAKNTRGND